MFQLISNQDCKKITWRESYKYYISPCKRLTMDIFMDPIKGFFILFSYLLIISSCGNLISGDETKPGQPIEAEQKYSLITPGQKYYVQSYNGSYLSQNLRSNSESSIELGGLASCRKTFIEIIETADQKILLKLANGSYFSAKPDGKIVTANAPSGWEAFTLIKTKLGTALQSFHNSYLSINEHAKKFELIKNEPSPRESLFFQSALNPKEFQHNIIDVSTVETEKVVWTFWDKGEKAMPPFYKLNVKAWRHLLGKTWTVRVISTVTNDENNVFKFITKEDLPATYNNLSPVVKSDSIRLALLNKYGGVHMDPSIILIKHLDEIAWDDLTDPSKQIILAGFYNEGYGSDLLDKKDYFENWFIATRKNNRLIARWKKVFNAYWNDRTESKNIWDHELFRNLDLSNFVRYGSDFRNYLNQHIAFRKIIEQEPDMREVWEKHTKLFEAIQGFYLFSKVGWDNDKIVAKLIKEKDEKLANELLQTQLMKFTSSSSAGFRNLTESELMNPNTTLGIIYNYIFR